jgi:hypothetical protein
MRQKPVAIHGKKSRRWLKLESDGKLSRGRYALEIEIRNSRRREIDDS